MFFNVFPALFFFHRYSNINLTSIRFYNPAISCKPCCPRKLGTLNYHLLCLIGKLGLDFEFVST
jgi:hypothetical protein